MSIKIMSAIFDSKTLGPTERLVMLALADHADDAGRCYPSNARLCERTGLSERAVRQNIRALEQGGFVTVLLGAGQGGANVYFVRPDGAPDAPRHEMPPGTASPTPRHAVPPKGAPDAPKPSGTINEPSKKSAQDAQDILAALVEVVSEETAEAFIAHRKAKRAKLTVHAAELIAGKIRGHPAPDAVVLESIANGWTGVFPEKVQAPAPRFTPQFDPAKFEGIQ